LYSTNKVTPKIRKYIEKQLKENIINSQIREILKKQLEENVINPRIRELLGQQLKKKLKKFGAPIVVTATTNYAPGDLDPAATRPGRMGNKVTINFPKDEDKVKILKFYLENHPLDENIDLTKFAKVDIEKRYSSGADLKFVVKEAAYEAIKKNSRINNDYLKLGLEKLIISKKKGKSFLN